jgi:hypothetical protein
MNTININREREIEKSIYCKGGEIFAFKEYGGYYILGYNTIINIDGYVTYFWQFTNISNGHMYRYTTNIGDGHIYINDGGQIDLGNDCKATLEYLGNSFKIKLEKTN